MTDRREDVARRDLLLRRARQALQGDNLALAEALAQEILAIEPADGVAWAIRAHMAALIGREDKAAAWGRRANPDVHVALERPRHDKVQALLAGCGPGADEERYLVARSLGYTFLTEIFHVLGALLLAEITDRQPCVLWGENSLFHEEGSDNAFPRLFNGIGTELLPFLRAAPADEIFPGKWHAAGLDAASVDVSTPPHRGGDGQMAALWLLNRPERVVVCDYPIGVIDLLAWLPDDHPLSDLSIDEVVRRLIAKFLVPNWRIRDRVAELMSRLEGRRTFAVHIRGAATPEGRRRLDAVNRQYPPVVEQAIAKDYAIWLVTEHRPIVDEYKARFGEAIFSQESLRAEEGASDRAEAIMSDVLVAASCDRFVGNGASNLSCLVDFLMEGDEARKHLFVPNKNRGRFLNLYE